MPEEAESNGAGQRERPLRRRMLLRRSVRFQDIGTGKEEHMLFSRNLSFRPPSQPSPSRGRGLGLYLLLFFVGLPEESERKNNLPPIQPEICYDFVKFM